MKTTNHTPGPWIHTKNDPRLCIKGTERLHCVSKRRYEFADIVLETIAENISEHDAPLIASAPDLLSALDSCLQIMLRVVGERLPINRGTECEETDWLTAIRKARVAISKAEGNL